MDLEKLMVAKERKGFIAALDQSGGSTSKTLALYGISDDKYSNEEEMFDLIHEMRSRVISNKYFNEIHIMGTILFYKTMNSKIDGKYTSEYLWENKRIVSFLKVDKGLDEEANGVKLMKEIPDLEDQLNEARDHGVFGTKMRSVIYSYNEEGIKKIVDQQFDFAKRICDKGLVPIIEPEVDINSPDKDKIEHYMHNVIKNKLNEWNEKDLIMFKFTIPTEDNLYLDLYDYPVVVRVVALSGGYPLDEACEKLSHNDRMIASFSRALLEKLRVNQTEEEFGNALNDAIMKIYNASI